MEEMRNAHGIFVGKPRNIWGANIRMDVLEIEWEGVDWTCFAQDRDK
jgi:hypothetical protein